MSTSRPSSQSHRLPTVSASQAFNALKNKVPRSLSTGLTHLDALLSPRSLGVQHNASSQTGGLPRGQVTEIYGPPGAGKTAFGLQVSKSALASGGSVVWIGKLDTATPPTAFTASLTSISDAATLLARPRVEDVLCAPPVPTAKPSRLSVPENGLSSSAKDERAPQDDLAGRFHHIFAPTLAHLLALFVRPASSFPPDGTALVVIDSLSTLFDYAYPRTGSRTGNKNDDSKWAAGRRYAVMNDLVSTLGKTATLKDIPVLLTNQTVTKMRPGEGALLMPAMAGIEWDSGIATRLVLFRDWRPEPSKLTNLEEHRRSQVRFVGVVKMNGTALGEANGLGAVVPFTIEKSGLFDVELKSVEVPMQPLTSPARSTTKRRYAEVADSDDELNSDELYGWGNEDDIAAEGLIDESDLAIGLARESSSHPPQQKKQATDQD
ncbi:P-loop containing nucleoside triphosphate hydrolase protein [Phyllosticta citrichinensis]|uniref:P-loop containing nucleoside triphosphate hydrolase protein n=1 Tax=Phyllosticta citrichinensis TaxID=1130410 RepID=A0ABR1Y4M0_9PEZI